MTRTALYAEFRATVNAIIVLKMTGCYNTGLGYRVARPGVAEKLVALEATARRLANEIEAA